MCVLVCWIQTLLFYLQVNRRQCGATTLRRFSEEDLSGGRGECDRSKFITHTNNFRSVLQAQIHTYSSKLITLETYSNKTHTLAHCWPGLRPLRKQQLRLMNNSRTQRNQKLLFFVWWVKMMWRVNMQWWVIWWLLWLCLFYWLFLLTQIRS